MDNPVTFSDITLLNTLATCANMTTDEVFKDFKIMAKFETSIIIICSLLIL